jgi:hypothetical protein
VQTLIDHSGVYDTSNDYGRKRYVKEILLTRDGQTTAKHLVFDQARWDQDARLDGYYAIITSETHLSDTEVIDTYRGLSRIEESFRVIKSDLDGRPVHVWTKPHINAHFLTCFLALTLLRIIQHATGAEITAPQTRHGLATATATPLADGIWIADETTDAYKTIESTWDVTLPHRYPTIETIRQYKRAIIANTPRTLQNHNPQQHP